MDKIFETNISLEVLSTEDGEYDKQAKALVNRLNKDNPAASTPLDYLNTIDPTKDTIVFVHILDYHISAARSHDGKAVHRRVPPAACPEGSLWPSITAILLYFDPTQVRYFGEPFLRIVDIVAKGAEQTQNAIPAIQLLSSVIRRLDPSSSTLTTIHCSFVRLCLLARAYSDAAQILDHPIYSLPNENDKPAHTRAYTYLSSNQAPSSSYLTPFTGLTGKLTSRSYLEYYFMAGMCYIGLTQYAKAAFCFEVVLTVPAAQNTASTIMVEAYKKWSLLGLLLEGTVPSAPKAVTQSTAKILRSMAKPYECLASAFTSGSLARLYGEVQEGREIWIQDYNLGLVHEVLSAFRKFTVVNLGKIFTALSMSEVARRISTDSVDITEATSYVSSLIADGRLHACLVASNQSGAPQILRFLNSPASSKSESQLQNEMVMKTLELQSLYKHISAIDHKLEISKDYIDYLKKLKKQKEQEAKDGPTKMANAFEEFLDEDVMGEF